MEEGTDLCSIFHSLTHNPQILISQDLTPPTSAGIITTGIGITLSPALYSEYEARLRFPETQGGFTVLQRYLLYLTRWQLSTPILWVCIAGLHTLSSFWSTVIANLIGGLMFFWVDRWIFAREFRNPMWEVASEVACVDCGKVARGYRLVLAPNYDKRRDTAPEFRCETCSAAKADVLRSRGVLEG